MKPQIPWLRVFVQGAVIVGSILLALALDAWGTSVGRRAVRTRRLRGAQLQHSQSMAGLKQAYENVILDVNIRTRQVQVSYDQIDPNFKSAEANQDQFEAIQARAESKNFVQLNQELNALQSLANSRRGLLQSIIDYNMSIIELERAKGTLPEYNNVILTADPE